MQSKTVNYLDKELREAVERQLDYDPAVPSNNIGVVAANGVVTLTGHVETYADKIAAEKAAKRVYGVKAVANDIEVKVLSEQTDTEIANSALQALSGNVSVPSNEIKVISEKRLADTRRQSGLGLPERGHRANRQVFVRRARHH